MKILRIKMNENPHSDCVLVYVCMCVCLYVYDVKNHHPKAMIEKKSDFFPLRYAIARAEEKKINKSKL